MFIAQENKRQDRHSPLSELFAQQEALPVLDLEDHVAFTTQLLFMIICHFQNNFSSDKICTLE